MKNTYRRILEIILVVIFLAAGFVITEPLLSRAEGASYPAGLNDMEVHFIDVGQGDSTLVTCGGQSMLIDTGIDFSGALILDYLQGQGIEKLDYLILTHPDADHIGGAPAIITMYDIGSMFVSNYESDDEIYQQLVQALDDKQLEYFTPEVGAQYPLGSAVMTILAPNKEYDNANDASIALLIQNGNNRFLFTGDAGEDAEKDILDNGINIAADVYHVGHHGSKSSSSREFVKAVNPSYAVISCGKDNIFSLPHMEVLTTLRIYGAKVYRTDEDGTIIAISDGENLRFMSII